jgi:3-mercaptopyruvate sulfurtransferase SseA
LVSPAATPPRVNGELGARELLDLIRVDGTQPVVDIRERATFAKGHVKDAINIPLSELEIRAAHELPQNRPVFLYCRYSSSCEGDAKVQGVVTYCALAEHLLNAAGVKHTRPLRGNLQELQQAGIEITGDHTEQP